MTRSSLLPSSVWMGACAVAAVVSLGLTAHGFEPVPVVDDPLVRMPGTQPGDGVQLDSAKQCLNCHDGVDKATDPGFFWQGSMMAHATRDPLFWASMAVAAQDSIWAIGRPNATDLCLRCHTPTGWLGGRSDPTNGELLAGADFDGVTCDACHRMIDPYFEDTFAGTREGNDWAGYWDESGSSSTPSLAAASATLATDRSHAAGLTLFNGTPMYDSGRPAESTWTESTNGQLFVTPNAFEKRASYADALPTHSVVYSRHHKSRYFCGSCHDVSNAVLANLSFEGTEPGDGSTVLPSESVPAHSYGHLERTFSELMLSAYAVGEGAEGVGPFAPEAFTTSQPGNLIASCQDCHMPDRSGVACVQTGATLRPGGSVEHPNSGQPLHDLTGGNAWVPYLLASTVEGSPNHDPTNAALLGQGGDVLTLDLEAGVGIDPDALLAGAARAIDNLKRAATLQNVAYDAATGGLTFRIRNNTGHKLISGYPEGRRMFVNVRLYDGGDLIYEVNPYDGAAGTLRGLPTSPNSPALGPNEQHVDALVYEVKGTSALTGEAESFHIALVTGRQKDNRIPPKGFRKNEAAARLSEPVSGGAADLGLFTDAEYAGGHDDVALSLPPGADGVEVSLYYQTTSREYVEFLRGEINGTTPTLSDPPPSGEPSAYVAQTDPFFDGLRAWGDTIWQLWEHNRHVAGAAPVLMGQALVGEVTSPCAAAGSDGTPCSDQDGCTVGDVCSAGACVPGEAVTCAASDACHLAGACDAATGLCSDPLAPDGAACADANACTDGDQCLSGVCVPGPPRTCPADTCNEAGTCNPSSGACTTEPKPPGTACDDGDLCTTADACGDGACAGTPVTCDPIDACHEAGVCQPATGQCAAGPAVADGRACDGGTCQSGVCTATPVTTTGGGASLPKLGGGPSCEMRPPRGGASAVWLFALALAAARRRRR